MKGRMRKNTWLTILTSLIGFKFSCALFITEGALAVVYFLAQKTHDFFANVRTFWCILVVY